MLNLDDVVSNKNTTEPSSSERNDCPFRMLTIGPSGSGKTNTLLHLINNLHPIDKIYLYAKDIDEKKYQFLINNREQAGLKNLNDPHAFIEYSDDMNDVLDDINNYNKNRNKKVLIVFDDIIADIEYNKNFKRIIKELFYRSRKINLSIVFTMQSYFRALKDARLNSTYYILMKIGNKKELKRIAEEKSGHLDCKDFLKIFNYCTRKPYSFMTIDTRPTATILFKKNFDGKLIKKKLANRKKYSKYVDLFVKYLNDLKEILFTKKSSGRGLTTSSLPIRFSRIYTNNSSKELINNIKQLVKNLYDNQQITNQVYNILNKALRYKELTF